MSEVDTGVGGPGEIEVDEGNRHPVSTDDVPRREVAVSDDSFRIAEGTSTPFVPSGVRGSGERCGGFVQTANHFAEREGGLRLERAVPSRVALDESESFSSDFIERGVSAKRDEGKSYPSR